MPNLGFRCDVPFCSFFGNFFNFFLFFSACPIALLVYMCFVAIIEPFLVQPFFIKPFFKNNEFCNSEVFSPRKIHHLAVLIR